MRIKQFYIYNFTPHYTSRPRENRDSIIKKISELNTLAYTLFRKEYDEIESIVYHLLTTTSEEVTIEEKDFSYTVSEEEFFKFAIVFKFELNSCKIKFSRSPNIMRLEDKVRFFSKSVSLKNALKKQFGYLGIHIPKDIRRPNWEDIPECQISLCSRREYSILTFKFGDEKLFVHVETITRRLRGYQDYEYPHLNILIGKVNSKYVLFPRPIRSDRTQISVEPEDFYATK